MSSLEITPKQAAEAADRYIQLKSAEYIIRGTGEVLTENEMKRELEMLQAILKPYIEAHGPVGGERGLIKTQERSTATTWDVKGLFQNDPDTYWRLHELGCLTINSKLADDQEKAGNVTMFRQYGQSGRTTALIVEKNP